MRNLNAEQLKSKMQREGDVMVIDVLPRENFESHHVPGAVNIPLKEPDFTSRVEKFVGDKSREVVVYCANKECDLSPNAAKTLEDAGFKNVSDFEGGIEEWQEQGYQIEKGMATAPRPERPQPSSAAHAGSRRA